MQSSRIVSISRLTSILLVSMTLFLFLSFNGCSKNDYGTNAGGGTPGANEIFIQNMSFSSGTKTVTAGTTLKWTNKDAYAHTVTSGIPGSPSGVFDSGNIPSQGSFSFTFSQAGTFKYYCRIHSSMTATITVQ